MLLIRCDQPLATHFQIMTLILGVGIGTIIVIFLWISSFILCFISLQTKSFYGPVYVVLAALCMFLLYIIPKESHHSDDHDSKELGSGFIWRICILAYLGLSTLIGGVYWLADEIMTVRQPSSVKTF